MTREPIYAAVFAFFAALTLGGTPAFKLATRKGKHWDDVAGEDQPALLMVQGSETAQKRKGLPTIWTARAQLLVYVRTNAQSDDSVIPSQLLNPLVDAIEAALTPDDISNDACTLGGLVSHCAIEGEVKYFEGLLGDEATAIVPLMFVCPA